jgi:ribosomal protein S10
MIKLNYNKNYSISVKVKSFIKNNLISDFLILLKRVLNLNTKTKNNKKETITHLSKNIYRNTIIRSPHVNKQAQEQFEIRTYNNLINIPLYLLTNSNINLIINLIYNNLPIGIDSRITIIEKNGY